SAIGSASFSKRNEALGAFVPQYEPDATQALQKGDAASVIQIGVIPQHLRQTVERDLRREMMDVMDADIPGDPAQREGQVVVGTAVQCGVLKIPVLTLRPVRLLELVLD